MASEPPQSPEQDEKIFAEALNLPVPERPAFLNTACHGDAALRLRIESLLEANDSALGFMESMPLALAKESEGVSSSPSQNAEPAESQIGRYKLLQKIGEGGCGMVYMAEQEEPVRRHVALKIIKLGMDTKAVIARFEAERQALALMDHPNIARVLDAGATEAGRPFFVMELVRGIKITDYCDQHQFSTAQRLEIFNQVCFAVQHAHQKGVIHRDLKPSNILVTLHDGEPVPKVIDFGIAKATQGRLTDHTLFTAFEQFIGTPAYMSPEQAEMSGLDVDTRSDIYSLGVLLYELLTGRPPFDPQTFREAGIDEIRRFIRDVEPPKPSTRLDTLPSADSATVARLRGTEVPKLSLILRGDIDWIVMKALDKNRTRRYETASALAADISRHLQNEPVVARPPSATYLLQKLVRRNQLAFGAAAAVAAALVIGLGVATWAFIREKAARAQAEEARTKETQQRALAEAGEARAKTAAAKSEQAFRFMAGVLTGVGPSVAAGRDTALLREILDKTTKRLETTLQNQPEVELKLRSILGTVYLDLGDYAKAESIARDALAKAEKLYGREHEEVSGMLVLLGEAQLLQGHGAESESLMREALVISRKFPGDQSENLVAALVALSTSLLGQGKLPEAETYCREALAVVRQHSDLENLPPDTVQMLLAGILQQEGRLAEAEPLFQEAMAAQKKRLGPDNPLVGETQLGFSSVLMKQGKLAEAEAQIREALATLRKSLGDEHPTIAMARFNLAFIIHQSGKLPEAELQYREVLALQKKILGASHPSTRQTETFLTLVLQQQHKSGEANTLQSPTAPPTMSPDSEALTAAGRKTDVAMAALTQGKFAEAETNLREALPVLEHGLGSTHQVVIGTRFVLAQTLLRQNKFTAAESAARELLTICRQAFGNSSTFVANTLSLLAMSLQAQGKLSEAETFLSEAIAIAKTQTTDGKNPNVAAALFALATIKAEQGELGDRDRLVSEASEMIGPLPENLKRVMHKPAEAMANMLKDQGRFANAVAVEQAALSLVRKLEGTESDATAWVLTTFAWLQNIAGQFSEGEASAREAAAIRRKILPADHWLISAAEFTVGESLIGQKKYPEAEPLLLSVFATMKTRGPENSDPLFPFWRDRLKYTAELLVKLYDATNQPAKSAEWKKHAQDYTVIDPTKNPAPGK